MCYSLPDALDDTGEETVAREGLVGLAPTFASLVRCFQHFAALPPGSKKTGERRDRLLAKHERRYDIR